MSNSTQSVIEGQGFYRIFDELPQFESLYEVDVSARAIAVGPESDYSSFDGYYLDSSAPSRISKFTVTADRPWIAQTYANLSETYDPKVAGKPGVPGKIFLTPTDFSYTASPTQFLFEPKVDLIVYTSSLPDILPKRTSKTFKGPIQLYAVPQRPLRIPFYGRRHFTITVDILDYIGTFDVAIEGIRKYFPLTSNAAVKNVQLTPTVTLATGLSEHYSYTYDALEVGNNHGFFDQIVLVILNAAPAMDPSTFPLLGIQIAVEVSD